MAVYFFKYPFATAGDRTAVSTASAGGTVSWQDGWTIDYQKELGVDVDAKPIPRDASNQIMYDVTNNLNQYQTHGVPDFITTADNLGVPFPYDIFSYVRYDDGGGYQVYKSLANANIALPTDVSKWRNESTIELPIGSMLDFAGAALPTRFLACDGSVVSQTTYAALFAVLSSTWNTGGEGAGNFRLPNFNRRVAVGSGGTGTGTLGNAVGNVGGEEAHAQTIAEMATHDHTGSFVRGGDGGGGTDNEVRTGLLPGTLDVLITMTAQGSGTAANVIQPSAVVLKIIKYI